MRVLILSTLLVLLAVPSFAQNNRAYVSAGGGFAISPDVTSGDVLSEAGVRIAPHLSVFGQIGHVHDLQPAALATTVDQARDLLSSATGLDVVATSRVPALYTIGGLRVDAPMRRRIAPYVLGGIGVSRLTPHAEFTYADGPLPDATAPLVGADVTSDVIATGLFAEPPATNEFTYSLGSGARFQLDRHMLFDAGYRFSHVDADTPLHAHSITFGVGYRF